MFSITVFGLICLSIFLVNDTNKIFREDERRKSLLNKPAVVTVYDVNKQPVKVNVHTIKYYDGMITCRVDNGSGMIPRFSEVRFFESEIEFIEPVEGK